MQPEGDNLLPGKLGAGERNDEDEEVVQDVLYSTKQGDILLCKKELDMKGLKESQVTGRSVQHS